MTQEMGRCRKKIKKNYIRHCEDGFGSGILNCDVTKMPHGAEICLIFLVVLCITRESNILPSDGGGVDVPRMF